MRLLNNVGGQHGDIEPTFLAYFMGTKTTGCDRGNFLFMCVASSCPSADAPLVRLAKRKRRPELRSNFGAPVSHRLFERTLPAKSLLGFVICLGPAIACGRGLRNFHARRLNRFLVRAIFRGVRAMAFVRRQ